MSRTPRKKSGAKTTEELLMEKELTRENLEKSKKEIIEKLQIIEKEIVELKSKLRTENLDAFGSTLESNGINIDMLLSKIKNDASIMSFITEKCATSNVLSSTSADAPSVEEKKENPDNDNNDSNTPNPSGNTFFNRQTQS